MVKKSSKSEKDRWKNFLFVNEIERICDELDANPKRAVLYKNSVDHWKSFFNKLRNKNERIDWQRFRLIPFSMGHVHLNMPLPKKIRFLRSYFGMSKLDVLLDDNHVDNLMIQPMPNDEPIFYFTKRNRLVITLWKGQILKKDLPPKITPNIIEIQIKLLMNPSVQFRADVSPMKEAIPALKKLGVVPHHRGGDRRKPEEKKIELEIVFYYLECLVFKDHFPTVGEISDWLANTYEKYQDEASINRILRRALPKVYFCLIKAFINEVLSSSPSRK